ncbi:unnamed protein product [Dracunculus medinensis]|uniref:Cadherin domain-containing protein n=1 Tax=Dracunculus medinensis TaxID=318479 RepID=A0A0N4U5L1_DRAME|nr:unnamed protein product [Dracunculus medinensis]
MPERPKKEQVPLDYEDPTQRSGFNVGVRVYDGRYYATTRLRIRLEDRNDNSPIITGPQTSRISEDATHDVLRHLCVKTPEQQLYLFDVFKPFSCSWDYPKVLSNLRHLVNILLLLTTFTICPFGAYAQEYSLPFAGGQFTGQSRFLSFSSKTSRDIIVTFTKNISEAIPVGELLATFRAEDKDSPSYNLT